MEYSQSYDVIIVGAGCAGLSAAMYLGRFGKKAVCLGEMPGGTITTTHAVENWPGERSISGFELGNKLLEHAKQYCEVRMEKVESVKKKADGKFEIKSDSGVYGAKTIIFATGTQWKKMGLESEKKFANKGVHYCAMCDGGFYKGKKMAVIGSGDSAAKESLMLAELGSKVYILVRGDKLKGEPINLKKVEENPKIEVIANIEVKEFLGGAKLEKLKLSRAVKVKGSESKSGAKNAAIAKEADGASDELEVAAAFVLIGHEANTALAKEIGVGLDERRQIKVDRLSKTNLPGVFAAGDCTDIEFKQAIVGASQGVVAAYSANEYLKKE